MERLLMETWDLAWRGYPAALLAALGAVLTVRGFGWLWASFRRPRSEPDNALTFMRGFRLAIWGLTALGVAAAWHWQLGWLLAIALVIGGEETLETSVAIAVMERRRFGSPGSRDRHDRRPVSPPDRAAGMLVRP